MLVQYLRHLDDLPKQRILAFFDGTNLQNVPKANALLTHLYRASQLSHIRASPENKSFVLLGELLGSFVHPYTVPTMSLTEQLVSLAKCGHLLFALYRVDGAKFLPGQLIYDMQVSIKNVVFCVAKTQVFDPSLPFYLLQTGTNHLESRFGTLRTTSSDRNGDILQMCEHASSAQCIDEIFSEHPNWNHTPYCLSLDGRSGIDHTNPSSWIRDVIVGHVNLHSAWLKGHTQAMAILKQAGVAFEFDPIKLQAKSLNIDLMLPNGAYPGIHVDYSEPELQPLSVPELEMQAYPDDHSTALGSYTAAVDSLPKDIEMSSTQLPLGDTELEIEQMLPPALQDATTGPNTTKKGWILVDGKLVHLESAVRYLLGSDSSPKSTDRLCRVCGFSRHLDSSSAHSKVILGDYFQVSDLVATFLWVNNKASLAIIRVTDIITNGASVESISREQFDTPSITLSGQILQLEYDSGVWYWTQKYDAVSSQETLVYNRKQHSVVEFAAHLSQFINPQLVERNGEIIWAFESIEMANLMDELWSICTAHSPGDNIPSCLPSPSFPYRSQHGEHVFITYEMFSGPNWLWGF
ncbi:hypothetical protein FRC11_010142 [Ceratobasidium sp. 423]|nr:hypothetical protein FRC11_010142 [Ceratobasidium sp. 423]